MASNKKNRSSKNKRRKSKPSSSGYSVLETRNLLASVVTFDSGTGVINIEGDQFGNNIDISVFGNNVDVQTDEGFYSFNQSQVTKIEFQGRTGDDSLWNETHIPVFAYGHGGDDLFIGGFGNDFFHGGNGNDSFEGRSGDDTIRGGDGNDTIRGDSGNDTLYGGPANDTIFAGSGDDFANGEFGNDLIYGAAGSDTILGSSGADQLEGGTGDDFIYGQHGNDTIKGDAGLDRVRGNPGDDILFGGDDNDFVMGDQGHDEVRGEDGNDTLFGFDGEDMLYGGDGDDVLYGGGDDDVIHGDDGDDLVRGDDGDDMLYGGRDDDRLVGLAGNDRLFGEHGTDVLVGGDGDDGLVSGGLFNVDVMFGGAGADRFLAQNTANVSDNLIDVKAEDALLNFLNETSDWTNEEMEVIDNGLFLLQQRTGNTALLKDSLPIGELTFSKYQTVTSPNQSGSNELTYDGQTQTYSRQIQIAEWNEGDSAMNDFFTAVAIRELGHNWDSALELEALHSSLVGEFDNFLAISDWQETNPGSGYTMSYDQQWFYANGTGFGDEYGKTNPFEDLSSTWEYYFATYENPNANHGNMQSKFDWADNFFETLS